MPARLLALTGRPVKLVTQAVRIKLESYNILRTIFSVSLEK